MTKKPKCEFLTEENLLRFVKENRPYIWDACFHFKLGESALRSHLRILLIKGKIRQVYERDDGHRIVAYEAI